MLRCDELRAGYGPVVALHGISLTVSQGEIVTLIGANGAGKSTTLKAIVGLVVPTGGRLTLRPDRIAGPAPAAGGRRGGGGLLWCRKLPLRGEPWLGLAPIVVEEVFRGIETVNRAGMTILLVEQNAAMALRAAHRGYVIERGRVVTEGPAARLIADPEVVAAYLGA